MNWQLNMEHNKKINDLKESINKLNKLSKSTALHSTLIIEDFSSCSSKQTNNNILVKKGLKISKKNIVNEKNYWKISGSHDGYLQKFGIVHEREIEFYPEQNKFVGYDKILRKNPNDTSAYALLSDTDDFLNEKKIISEMENLYQNKNLADDDVINLSFPLGKFYDYLKKYLNLFLKICLTAIFFLWYIFFLFLKIHQYLISK